MAQEFVSNTLLFVGVILGPLSLLTLMFWFIGLALRDFHRKLIQNRQRQATLCYHCLYFSGNEALKCAVNPYEALTQAAENCNDYSKSSSSPHKITWWYYKL